MLSTYESVNWEKEIRKIVKTWYHKAQVEAANPITNTRADHRHAVPSTGMRQFNKRIVPVDYDSCRHKKCGRDSCLIRLKEVSLDTMTVTNSYLHNEKIADFAYLKDENNPLRYSDVEELFLRETETQGNETIMKYNKFLSGVLQGIETNISLQIPHVEVRASLAIRVASQWARTKKARKTFHENFEDHNKTWEEKNFLETIIQSAAEVATWSWNWIISDEHELLLTPEPVLVYAKPTEEIPEIDSEKYKNKMYHSFFTTSTIMFPFNKNILLVLTKHPNLRSELMSHLSGESELHFDYPTSHVGIKYDDLEDAIDKNDHYFYPKSPYNIVNVSCSQAKAHPDGKNWVQEDIILSLSMQQLYFSEYNAAITYKRKIAYASVHAPDSENYKIRCPRLRLGLEDIGILLMNSGKRSYRPFIQP